MTFLIKQIKTWVILLIISFLILTASYVLGDRQGLIIGSLICFFIVFFTMFLEPTSPLTYFKAEKNYGRDPWSLLEMNDYLCSKIKMSPPEVYIIPNNEPLILVISSSLYKPAVAFSDGLLKILKTNEIEAILTLALTSLKEKDHWYSHFFERIALTLLCILENFKRISPTFLHTLLNFIFEPLICLFFKLSHTISNQLFADQEAKKHLNSPTVLAHTLWNIYGSLTNNTKNYPLEIQHYLLVHPHAASRKFIPLHPTIEKRLKNLVGYFPI